MTYPIRFRADDDELVSLIRTSNKASIGFHGGRMKGDQVIHTRGGGDNMLAILRYGWLSLRG